MRIKIHRFSTFSMSGGDNGCRQCGENTYSGAGASSCTSCPKNDISAVGSTSEVDCKSYGNDYFNTTITTNLLSYV